MYYDELFPLYLVWNNHVVVCQSSGYCACKLGRLSVHIVQFVKLEMFQYTQKLYVKLKIFCVQIVEKRLFVIVWK